MNLDMMRVLASTFLPQDGGTAIAVQKHRSGGIMV